MTISQPLSAEGIVANFEAILGRNIVVVVDLKLHRVDKDEPDGDESFRSFVEHKMWLANPIRSPILNANRGVASYPAAPNLLHN